MGTKKSISLNRIFRIVIALAVIFTSMAPSFPVTSESLSPLAITIESPTVLRLNWVDGFSSEVGYRVDRKIDGGNYTEIIQLGANSISYPDSSQQVSPGHTYTYRVRALLSNGLTSVYTNEVSTTTTAVAMADSLKITSDSTSQLTMVWTYPEGRSYDTLIERRAAGTTSWQRVAQVGKGILSYSDSNLDSNVRYFYKVTAVSGDSVSSLPYPDKSVGKEAYTKIPAPTSLYGFAALSTQINLNWADTSNPNTFTTNSGKMFYIERKTGSAGNYVKVATVQGNLTSWSDTGLTPSTRYFYRIKLRTGDNESDYSEELSVITTLVERPTNFMATAISDTRVQLQWHDSSFNESGFEIWRRPADSQEWEMCGTVGRNEESFTDVDLTPDKSYYYRIRAYVAHSSISSGYTNEIGVWTISLENAALLSATVQADSSVRLHWVKRADNISGFVIETRAGVEGDWVPTGTVPASFTELICPGLKEGEIYFFRLKAFENEYINSSFYSNEVGILIGRPAAPSDLSLQVLSSNQIKLKWKINSNNEAGFKIERRSHSEGSFKEIAQVASGTSSFVDSGLLPQKSYYYRIKASNDFGDSSYVYSFTYSTTMKGKTFNDITSQPNIKLKVDNLASRGLFDYLKSSSFKPDQLITRGEFIHLLVRSLKLNATAAGSFADVKSSHIYYKDIMTAKKMGIISGGSRDYFYPGNRLSREDMASWVFRAMKSIDKPLRYFDYSILEEFEDKDDVSSGALSHMASVCGERVMVGVVIDDIRYLMPQGYVKRSDAASVIYNIIDR